MSAEEKLVAALKATVDEAWRERQKPVLLSALPRLLESNVPEYRDALAGRSFKMFVRETETSGGYTLVEHPSIRAKVAVAPVGADYQFPLSEPSPQVPKASARQVTLEFLAVLSNLSEVDQEKVVLPVSVLSKLLK